MHHWRVFATLSVHVEGDEESESEVRKLSAGGVVDRHLTELREGLF